jgi:hypothetical protein
MTAGKDRHQFKASPSQDRLAFLVLGRTLHP